jgi:hypothetical protein
MELMKWLTFEVVALAQFHIDQNTTYEGKRQAEIHFTNYTQ